VELFLDPFSLHLQVHPLQRTESERKRGWVVHVDLVSEMAEKDGLDGAYCVSA